MYIPHTYTLHTYRKRYIIPLGVFQAHWEEERSSFWSAPVHAKQRGRTSIQFHTAKANFIHSIHTVPEIPYNTLKAIVFATD